MLTRDLIEFEAAEREAATAKAAGDWARYHRVLAAMTEIQDRAHARRR